MAGDYVRDVLYGSVFAPAQAPIQLALVCAAADIAPPDPRAPFRYVELCCGDGLTLCVLAACYPHASFVGVDFNARHIERGRALAARGRLDNVVFHLADVCDALDEQAEAAAFVSIAGAFSWLDAVRQERVLQHAARLLRPGGLFHIHYASKPGALQGEALHEALALIAPARGSSVDRLSAALEELSTLAEEGVRFFADNPVAARRLKEAAANRIEDEAHEILSRGEGPLWFAQLMARLVAHDFAIVGEADTQRPIMGAEAVREETLLDLRRNRTTRQDVYVRGAVARGGGKAFLQSLTWLASARFRADPQRHAAKLAIAPDCARELSALMDGATNGALIMRTLGVDVDILMNASRSGLAQPLLRRTEGDASLRLSPFNVAALRQSLEAAPLAAPLAAVATGTQLMLPLAHRLCLYAITGGDVDALLAPLSPDRAAALRRGLTPEALDRFRAQAAPELRRLGVVI
jgi:SAM-dependent methyltransferase